MIRHTISRDALERCISGRLLICSEDELRAIDRMLIAIEKRRDLEPFLVERDIETSPGGALMRAGYSASCTYISHDRPVAETG